MSTNEQKKDFILIKVNRKNIYIKIFIYIVLITLLIIFIYPLIWVLFNSFKTTPQFFENQWNFPIPFNLENIIKAWTKGNIGKYMINSIFVTTITLGGLIFIATLTGFAFAKLKFRFRNQLFFLILAGLMFPAQVILIPLFMVLADLGLINTYPGLILTYMALNLPFATFLLRSFFLSVPNEIMEAAKIDGCNNFQVLWKVLFPIIRPGISVLIIFAGINIWNEFLFAMIFLQSPDKKTLPAGLIQFTSSYAVDFPGLFSALLITITPIIIIIIIFQNYIIKGLTAGSLKM